MNDDNTKTCTKCGKTYPATAEYWRLAKNQKSGLRPSCKSCCRQYDQARGKDKRVRQMKRKNSRRFRERNPFKSMEANNIREAQLLGIPFDFPAWKAQRAINYFNGCCAVCGRQLKDLFDTHTVSMDHWIAKRDPRPDNPGTVATNMIPLCHGIDGCNNHKKNRDPIEWLVQDYGTRKAKPIIARVETFFDWIREQDGDQ